jgi:hypothetical protein
LQRVMLAPMAEPQTIDWNVGASIVLVDPDHVFIERRDPTTVQWLPVPSDTFIIYWTAGNPE